MTKGPPCGARWSLSGLLRRAATSSYAPRAAPSCPTCGCADLVVPREQLESLPEVYFEACHLEPRPLLRRIGPFEHSDRERREARLAAARPAIMCRTCDARPASTGSRGRHSKLLSGASPSKTRLMTPDEAPGGAGPAAARTPTVPEERCEAPPGLARWVVITRGGSRWFASKATDDPDRGRREAPSRRRTGPHRAGRAM